MSLRSLDSDNLHQIFIALQNDSLPPENRLWNQVLEHGQYLEKLGKAVKKALQKAGAPKSSEADVFQETALRMMIELRKSGGSSWRDHGEDKFGGWLWRVCYRMALRVAREEPTTTSIPEAIDLIVSPGVPDDLYRKAMAITLRSIRSCRKKKRRVMRQWLLGWSCERSAEKLKISKNWVHKIRTEGKETIARELQELAGTYF